MSFFRAVTLCLLITPVFLSAQKADLNDQPTKPKVSEEEIRTGKVDFVNANNLPGTAEAREQNYTDGKELATEVISNSVSNRNGMTVKRVYNAADAGFGADILTIEPGAYYAHVNVIQRTIAGYLQKSFEYTPADSEVVSRFVLYYNAKQRGAIDKAKGKYSDAVIGAIDPAKFGIDRSYQNWAGRTQIVIPLLKNVVRPGKTDLNTSEIKKETETAKKEDKKQFNEIDNKRKEETNTKLEQKQDQLKKQEQQIETKKQEISKQQTEVQKQKEDTGKKLQELRQDPVKNATEIKKEEQKQQQEVKKEEELKKQAEVVKAEEKTNKEEQKEVKDQKTGEVATATKTDDPKKMETLQKENTELKKKEEEREQKSENVVGEKILFLRFVKFHSDGHYSNELWMLDPVKDDTLFRSPFTNICGREFVVVQGQGVLVIGYEGSMADPGAHQLVMLTQDKLEVKAKSKENIYWKSPTIPRDGKIYAIELKDGQYYLSRFNPDMSLEMRSSEPINSDSDITFYNEKIYVTGKAQGAGATTIKVFNRADLKHLKTIQP